MTIKKTKPMIFVGIISIIIITLLTIFILNAQKDNSLTYDQKVAIFQEENKTFKKGQIVFIGDSITQNYNLYNHYGNLDLECYNRGISGDTTDWLLYRLQVSLFELAPEKIVLMIGTNDINSEKSAQEIAESYEKILNSISTNLTNSEVFCISIIPQNLQYSEKAYTFNQKIITTNFEIKKIAEKYSYEYVNLYDKLTDENGLLKQKYTSDGLHLNNSGYEEWTTEMKSFFI